MTETELADEVDYRRFIEFGALYEAGFVPGRRDVLRLRGHAPADQLKTLVREGLVTHDDELRDWVLTERGRGVRDVLLGDRSYFAGGLGRGGLRPTIAPCVDEETARRLRATIGRGHHRRGDDARRLGDWVHPSVRDLILLPLAYALSLTVPALVVGFLLHLAVTEEPFSSGFLFFCVGWALVVVVLWAVVSWRCFVHVRDIAVLVPVRDGYLLAQENEDRFVCPDDLDARGRYLLARAQAAVDGLREKASDDRSRLEHPERARKVSADAEWSVAEKLREQALARRELDHAAPVGELEHRVLAEDHASVDAESVRVEVCVRALEEYVRRLRDADLGTREGTRELMRAGGRTAAFGRRAQEEALDTVLRAVERIRRPDGTPDAREAAGPRPEAAAVHRRPEADTERHPPLAGSKAEGGSMTPGQFIDAALWYPEAAESEPFGPGTLVYKVAGQKMFALLFSGNDGGPATVNLKCDPGLALELRDQFPAVTPGYHMNKRHWNSVLLDGTVPDDEVLEMLRHSYFLVARSLRSYDRERVLAVLEEDSFEPGTAPERA